MSNLNKVKGYRQMVPGLTQSKLAEAVGMIPGVYISKENGKRKFKMEELVKIYDYFTSIGLQISLEDLIR